MKKLHETQEALEALGVWDAINNRGGGGTVITGGSASNFTDLLDTPANYSGQGEKLVAVRSTEDGLEFATIDIDHGTISGLSDNDHPQYVLKAGDTMTGGLAVDVDSDEEALVIQDSSTKKFVAKWSSGNVTFDIPSEEPENKVSNPNFASDISGWSATSPVTLTNANGEWALVPGNTTYGTNDFYVMKHEAKYDANGDGDGDTPAEADAADACTGTTGCTAYSGAGFDYRDITTFDKDKVVSTANGAPIVHITHSQAIDSCPTGYHLINNNEWMTIARNIENQTENWADGTIGSNVASGGGLKRGNVGITDSVSYDGADPEGGTGRDTKAKHVLSNGSEIWDISGNVWEFANFDADNDGIYDEAEDLISLQDQPEATSNDTDPITDSNFSWSDFTEGGGLARWLLNNGSGVWGYDDFRPERDTLNASHGVGRLYHWSNSSNATQNRVVLRGGRWVSNEYAGVFCTNLHCTTSTQASDVGLRCASGPVDILLSHLPSSGRAAGGAAQVAVGTVTDARFVQSLNVADTSTYYLSAYVYNNTTGSVGGVVDATVATLYYGGNTITNPQYTEVVGETGWYLLTGTVTGVASNIDTGLVVKKGKTVIVDDMSLQVGVAPTTKLNITNSGSGIAQFSVESTTELNSGNSTSTALDVKGHAAQTANLQEWQNSSGTVLSAVDKDGNVGIGTTSPAQKLHVAGAGLITDKLAFTQTDLNEYIDSLADGYMDYGATTGHRFNTDVDITGNCEADTYSVGGVAGTDKAITVLDADGTTTHALTFSKGVLTACVTT